MTKSDSLDNLNMAFCQCRILEITHRRVIEKNDLSRVSEVALTALLEAQRNNGQDGFSETAV